MEQEKLTSSQKKKVEELHWEMQNWKSNFQFMDNEIMFIIHLLDPYAFQPNTPNLFERLQNYKTNIERITAVKEEVRKNISIHENTMSGMLGCSDTDYDLEYYRKHDKLKAEVVDCLGNFKNLKFEIFNYAGLILKKRKP